MFKHDKEHKLPESSEDKGLYYYIGIDLNQATLWKQTSAPGMLSTTLSMTNIALTEPMLIDAPVPGGQQNGRIERLELANSCDLTNRIALRVQSFFHNWHSIKELSLESFFELNKVNRAIFNNKV